MTNGAHAPNTPEEPSALVEKAAAELTQAQIDVVERFLSDPARNKAAAYRKVHPDVTVQSAWTAAARMFGNVKVRRYLAARLAEIRARYEISPERLLEELAAVALANSDDYFEVTAGGHVRLKPTGKLTREQKAAIAEAGESVTKDGGSSRIKLHNKLTALEMLGKHFGLFPSPDIQGDGRDSPGSRKVDIQVTFVHPPARDEDGRVIDVTDPFKPGHLQES